MTASLLPAALRAGPRGLYAIEAATGLIIARESWLARDDFACFIHAGNSISDPGTERPASTGKPRSPPWTSASCPARAESGGCSVSLPASPIRPP